MDASYVGNKKKQSVKKKKGKHNSKTLLPVADVQSRFTTVTAIC